MIHSYDFFENYQDFDVNRAILEEEKNIAAGYIRKNKIEHGGGTCPVCGETGTRFTVVFGVEYLKCVGCMSIFVDVSPDFVNRYNNNSDVLKIKEKYVSVINEDFNLWLHYRALRYLGGEYDKKDIAMCLDKIHGEADPLKLLRRLRGALDCNGLLILSTRLGDGFETLTTGFDEKGGHLFPYKYVFLPTIGSLEQLMGKAGFELLEFHVPQTRDVALNRGIKQGSLFLDHLVSSTSQIVRNDFQRFLQKNGLSSYARFIAKAV